MAASRNGGQRLEPCCGSSSEPERRRQQEDRLRRQGVQGGQARAEALLGQAVAAEGHGEHEGDPRQPAAGDGEVERREGADADGHPLQAPQPFAEDDHNYPDPDRAEKNKQICHGTEDVYNWAKKHGVKVAFGTDLLLEPQAAARQSVMASRMGEFYSNAEALRMLAINPDIAVILSDQRMPGMTGDAMLAEAPGSATWPTRATSS